MSGMDCYLNNLLSGFEFIDSILTCLPGIRKSSCLCSLNYTFLNLFQYKSRLKKVADVGLIRVNQDRDCWRSLKEGFVKQL